MFWSKYKGFNTVKFKIALLCAILYILCTILCALIVYSGKYNAVSRRMDPIIRANLDAAEFEYLTGLRAGGSVEHLPFRYLPRDEQELCRKLVPDLEPIMIYRANPAQPFRVVGHVRKVLYQIRLGKNDAPSVVRVDPRNHLPLLQKDFDDRAALTGWDLVRSRLLDKDDNVLAASHPPENVEDSERLYRNFRTLDRKLFDGSVIEIGYSRTPFQNQFGYYSERLLLVLLVLPFLGFFSGWVAADRMLAGVRRVTAAARRIMGGDYSQRVPQPKVGQEIDELVSTFNMMNANTEELFHQLRTVTDDVAHDLRTPITRIRGLAEVTIQGPQDLAAYRDALGGIAEECDAMIAMINTMLEIARAESGLVAVKHAPVDLNDLLGKAMEIFQPAAEEAGLHWESRFPNHSVVIPGDKVKLQRIVANLLDNALKFLEPGRCFRLSLAEEGENVLVTASDNGPGIPDPFKEKVFDRFFRLDSSRTKRGNGLGLAMTRAFVRAHGGEIRVEDTPGGGATFIVTIPKNGPQG